MQTIDFWQENYFNNSSFSPSERFNEESTHIKDAESSFWTKTFISNASTDFSLSLIFILFLNFKFGCSTTLYQLIAALTWLNLLPVWRIILKRSAFFFHQKMGRKKSPKKTDVGFKNLQKIIWITLRFERWNTFILPLFLSTAISQTPRNYLRCCCCSCSCLPFGSLPHLNEISLKRKNIWEKLGYSNSRHSINWATVAKTQILQKIKWSTNLRPIMVDALVSLN